MSKHHDIQIRYNEIIYNGTRYIPDPEYPVSVKVYVLHPKTTPMRVYGKTPAIVLTKIKSIQARTPRPDWSVIISLYSVDKELSRHQFSGTGYDQINETLSSKVCRPLLKSNKDVYTKTPK